MAEINAPIIWVSNLRGEQVGAISELQNLELEERLQSIDELRFIVRADDPAAAFLIPDVGLRYAEAGQPDRFYRVAEIDQVRTGTASALITIRADALWLELNDDTLVGLFGIGAATPAEGIGLILATSPWAAGTVPIDTTTNTIEASDQTVLSVLRQWAAVTGYELSFNTAARLVNLVTAVGDDNGAGFAYGRNVSAISRRHDPPIATRLYPFGAGGLTIESASPGSLNYVENYDYYLAAGLTLTEARDLHTREQVWVDERFLGAVALYDRAVERLAELSAPTVSYEAAVIDITKATGIVERYAVGDTVKVNDQLLGLDLTTRVVRLIRRPLDPRGDDIELAFLRSTSADTPASARPLDYGATTVLVGQSDGSEVINDTVTAWASIQITVVSVATIITGATFIGTATGSGTIRHELTVDGVPVGLYYDTPFTNGQRVEHSWPSYAADIAEGSHVVQWRANRVAGTGTVALADGSARAWLSTKGASGVGFGGGTSQYITESAPYIAPTALAAEDIYAETGVNLEVTPSAVLTLVNETPVTDTFTIELDPP
jgi:phage minor structural protein